MGVKEEQYRCGYCGSWLLFDTDETIHHVIRHVGEFLYLPAFHRHLERLGHDELSAHITTLRAAQRLARPRAHP